MFHTKDTASAAAKRRICARLPTGSHRAVVRSLLGAVPAGRITWVWLGDCDLQIEVIGDVGDVIAHLGRVRAESCAAAGMFESEVWPLPQHRLAALDQWSASVLRFEHADALLNALTSLTGCPAEDLAGR